MRLSLIRDSTRGMKQALTILMAQINPKVGAIFENADKIIHVIQQQQAHHDIIIFPELALTGYPPEDLLLRHELYRSVESALDRIESHITTCHAIIGHPSFDNGRCYNSASILANGHQLVRYHKQLLPNYGVFDEKRYFTPGDAHAYQFSVNGHQLGLCICEDLWQQGPVDELIQQGTELLICINASPFDYDKYDKRLALLKHYANQGLNIVYVNQVGGQDELVFDGQSLALDPQGNIAARAPAFIEHLQTLTFADNTLSGDISPLLNQEALIYQALVSGLRDYVAKNHFQGVVLGLSGGIDSALTLTIAADALGSANVHAVMMPSRYTAAISDIDAKAQLKNLNIESSTLPIEPAFKTILHSLTPALTGHAPDITEENIQARIRGLFLMALSNKLGYLLLTTSNKSETAVGYATLYGDMAGGFSVLKDVLKTQVYALARYRNAISPVIPERVLSRPPSAELAANQLDQNTLPPYHVLDAIITLYMEDKLGAKEIIARGYTPSVVLRVLKLISRNEYKRRQAAPGVKISPCAFGRDWRYPITSGFTPNGDG